MITGCFKRKSRGKISCELQSFGSLWDFTYTRIADRKRDRRFLNLDTRVAEATLASLESLNLVSRKKDNCVPTEHDLHISKDSAFAGHYHGGWRLKTASRLVELPRNRYSEENGFGPIRTDFCFVLGFLPYLEPVT